MSTVTAVPLRAVRRAVLITLWVGIAALIVGAFLLSSWGTRAQVAMATPPEAILAENGKKSGVVTTPSGLQYKVMREGAGAKAGLQDFVIVNYDGQFADGTSFDASAKHGGPATLPVAEMIPGWIEGLQLMNKGSKFRFWLPPSLAYGASGAGNGAIPPNSLLIFDVEMLEIVPRPPAGGMGMGMDPMPQGAAPQQ